MLELLCISDISHLFNGLLALSSIKLTKLYKMLLKNLYVSLIYKTARSVVKKHTHRGPENISIIRTFVNFTYCSKIQIRSLQLHATYYPKILT